MRWFALGASGRNLERSPVLKVRPVRDVAPRQIRTAAQPVPPGLFGQQPANMPGARLPQGKAAEKKLDAVRLLSVLIDALAKLEAELTGPKGVPTPKGKDSEDQSILH
ncbi:MAG: hypothetical protein HY701_09265 [Gemmatimonadetes bacterium]|nr:hypothetical protein [Gemmatimonadota bacterium]